MRPEDWTRIRRDFERARELEPGARGSFLAGLEPTRAREVRALLAADARDGSLLDEDALALQTAVLGAEEENIGTGTVIGDLTLTEFLGEGGSARVYRARRATDGKPDVAVKVLKAEAGSPGVLRRFAQERETLAGLEHPGLIRLLDAGRLADGRPYLVTEFVDGLPLDRYCATRPRRERLRLFVALCEAVHHAHRHLVVHRDLKPSNLLVTAAGAPKVLDFGIAKLLDPARDPRWTDVYGRGPLTPAFASPEQLRGEPVSTATDVYSLGVVLTHLVTGAGPYRADGSDRAALERAVIDEPPRPPDEVARASGLEPVPGDLATILACALRKVPEARYPSVEHLAEDVRRFLDDRPPLAQREPWGRRLRRFARAHPLASGVLLAGVLLLAGGWFGARRSLARVRASETIAWRAHASAVRSTALLAGLLERLARRDLTTPEDLRAVLVEAEANLAALGDAPEAEGRMRLALAPAELALGHRETARVHAERALELAETTPGFGWRDRARCLEILMAIEGEGSSAIELAARRARLVEEAAGLESDEARAARADEQALRARSADGAAR